jgi:S1-C subfamily serine protease
MHTRTLFRIGVPAGFLAVLGALVCVARGDDLDKRLQQMEAQRIAAIEKVKPAVVAVFSPGGQGGGSGVLISDDGYALTNFHVVAGSGPVMQCGLPDGVLYNGVVVGIDKVGDVSLIKLLPKKDGQKFPFAKLGDSDKLKAGDWSLAMGNPFLLATDFTPTVTYGLISGVHRYQYPEGALLEYTDCIQIDTSINPGNSGGPLFNIDGELVGINGRGSFDKRGRVNSGVGYAISINQIKNFLGHLRAGLDADHASLGAFVQSDSDDDSTGRLVITSLLENSDAARRGLDNGDELVSFAGRPLATVNQFKNVLGLYPRGWRVPVVYRHEDDKKQVEKREVLVRLMGVQRQEIKDPNEPQPPDKPPDKPPQPQPKQPAVPKPPVPDSPAAKLYEPKTGFANFYFNRQERDRLLAAFKKHGDFTTLPKEWIIDAEGEVKQRNATTTFTITEVKEADGKNVMPKVLGVISGIDYTAEPLKPGVKVEDLKEPRASGGLLVALYHWQQLLAVGEKSFTGGFSHGGVEPFYPPPADGTKTDFFKQRVLCEVLRTEQAGVSAKWYFSQDDQTLLGFEVSVDENDDPCEVYLSDYRKVDGRDLPHRIEVRYADNRYAKLTVKKYSFAAPK